MKTERRQAVKFICTLIGCTTVLLPSGVVWYWGNLSIYVYSYIHFHKDTTTSSGNNHDVKAPWILSINIITNSFAMLVAGHLQSKRCCSRTVLIFLAMLLTNGGLLSSYFVLDKSIKYLNITVGVLSGFGNGLLFSVNLQTVVDWAGCRIGLVSSTVLSGISVGAVLINQIATHYVNPDNLKVNKDVGRTKYFSQIEILERVPNLFLILTGLTLSCQILGLCIIYPRRKDADLEGDDAKSTTENGKINDLVATSANTCTSPLLGNLMEIDSKSVYVDDQRGRQNCLRISYRKSSIQNYYGSEGIPDTSKPTENEISKSPKEVLCSSSFYILWLTVASADSTVVLICNYYKAFGQVWIKDDHFLANLGTAMSVVNIAMRLIWGLVLDHINFKTSLVVFASLLSIVNSFYFFTPRVSKWLYFFWTLVYGSACSGMFSNFASITSRLYGKEHFHTNYGLLFTSTIAINLVAPPAFRFLLQQWGWFAVFASAGCLCALSLVTVVGFLPRQKARERSSNK